MILKKVQIYTNRITDDLSPYLTYVYQYYIKHGVTLNFDITAVDVTGYQSLYQPIAAGGSGYVLQGATSLVETTSDHDIHIFMFDLNEWKSPWYWPYPLRWDMPRSSCVLFNGKPFINLGFYNKDQQGTTITFTHELMHALAKIYGTADVMDNYIDNNFPDSPTGNFAQQWTILNTYIHPMTKIVTITRNSDNGTETLGTLVAQNNGATFSCSTLELPWKDNQHDISCIPKGTYQVSMQPFHNTMMYELQGTAPRTAIYIHPGNYFKDVLGCILLGVHPTDINGDGQIDVTSSVLTVNSFIGFMGKTPFTLIIN